MGKIIIENRGTLDPPLGNQNESRIQSDKSTTSSSSSIQTLNEAFFINLLKDEPTEEGKRKAAQAHITHLMNKWVLEKQALFENILQQDTEEEDGRDTQKDPKPASSGDTGKAP